MAALIVGTIALVAGVGIWFLYPKGSDNNNAPPSDGWPRTVAELNRWYAEPPDGQNTARSVQPGLEAMHIGIDDQRSPLLPWIGKAPLPPPTQPLSDAMRAEIDSLLQRNPQPLASLLHAVPGAGSRYPVDFHSLSLPHLHPLQQAVRVICLSALIWAEDDGGTQAGTLILRGLALAGSLEPEPTLMSQLTRINCLTALVQALEQVVNRTSLPAETLVRLQDGFHQAARSEAAGVGFTRALAGERVLILAQFQSPEPELTRSLELYFDEVPAGALRDLPGQQRAFDRFVTEILDARGEPLPARLMVSRQLIAATLGDVRARGYGVAEASIDSLMWENATRREALGLANLRLAEAALAVERWRAARDGRLPDSLDELAPEFLTFPPSDPFNDGPLRYRRHADGYQLSCAGAEPAIVFTVAW